MREKRNRRVLIGLLAVLVASFGCNPILAPFYLFGGLSNVKADPDFKLYETARHDKKRREFRIVVLPYRSRTLSPDFIGKERELATMFVRQLNERFKANKEYIRVVEINDVQKFQATHSGWQSMEATEIGKHFGADYVIDMELTELRLYERKSKDMLFNGYCRVSLTVTDTEKTGEEPLFKNDFPMTYPKGGPRYVDLDTSVEKFQQDFFNQLSIRLAWALTAHPTEEKCECYP